MAARKSNLNNPQKHTLLIVDDEADIREQLAKRIASRMPSLNVITASREEEALKKAQSDKPQVAIVDLHLDSTRGVESGFSLIDELLKADPAMRIIVITGLNSDDMGIRALRHGAASFVVKPPSIEHLIALINDGLNYANLKRRLEESYRGDINSKNIKGLSSSAPSMNEVIQNVVFAASHSQPVFIYGETGTGKSVIAHAIHSLSQRNKAPFIRIQPTFGNHDLISSELFGHEKGAFTGALERKRGILEEVHHGTLFIDEVDELPHDTQVMLLHVLQEKVFRKIGSTKELLSDFRLITATNADEKVIHKEKKLRPDFFHRIAHLTITLPPLRERAEDIPLLARTFLEELAARENLTVHSISDASLHQLAQYNWPGNIRELQAVVEGAAYKANFHNRRVIEINDITLPKKNKALHGQGLGLREMVRAYENKLVEEALLKNNNNQSEAAKYLKLDRSSFRRILKDSSAR